MHCSHGQKNYGNMSIEKLSPFQETNNYGNGRVPKSTLTWKKQIIWKFTCSASRPIRKGSIEEWLEILEVCIFMRKTELWKITARREADFYRPMTHVVFSSFPFFQWLYYMYIYLSKNNIYIYIHYIYLFKLYYILWFMYIYIYIFMLYINIYV
jgi:hypothetical protein